MKKQLSGLMTILTILSACQKNEVLSLSEHVTIHATIEDKDATRTVMDENNNVLWSENDKIIAFMKSSYGYKYQVKPSFIGKSYADFSVVASNNGSDLSAGNEWEHNVVYYPYSEDIECLKSGSNYTLEVNLPSEQIYMPDSFANGSMPMVAVSENNSITFKNILGGIKLQLKGTQKVTSLKIEGKNNEKLSGAANVTAYTAETKPTITMAADASTSVTLNCGAGVQLNESTTTEFIIALPPVLFSKGFAVTVTDSENNTYAVETDKENTVFRSRLLVMPEISLGASSSEDNESQKDDYVDEYGINHGKGIEIDGVVWAPVNCGYHAADYKYGKLYQWGRKYGQGYDGMLLDIDGNYVGWYTDSSVPTIIEGGLNVLIGNEKSMESFFYTSTRDYNHDWAYPQDDKLWNSGTEEKPVKTEYDPCPTGWRVPTYDELDVLQSNRSSWTTNAAGQVGYWFSGASTYTSDVPQIFFSAAGYLNGYAGYASQRGHDGAYWSSKPYDYFTYCLNFGSGSTDMYLNFGNRAYGYSVRCVQE